MKSHFVATACFVLALVNGITAAEDRRVDVTDEHSLAEAIAGAKAGDEIIIRPATYRLARIGCKASGTAEKPITIRSDPPLAAKLEFDALEGFVVSGSYWHFEGLDIRGVCRNHSDCEHAFHVVGAADQFILRGSRIFDFNAHVKVNSSPGREGRRDIPDNGLIEGNEFGNRSPRDTESPVTPVNIDNGSNWIVASNYVHDFQQGMGSKTSHGIFVKGGGRDPIFEGNLVICQKDVGPGPEVVTVGLSFGGGGMAAALCAPAFSENVPCDPEVSGGIMRNNIVANCTDVGIYLNRAKGARLLHNTLIGTSGIDVRFTGSSAEIHGNVVSGPIRKRNGGLYSGADNLPDIRESTFDAWYVDPLHGDLRRRGNLSAIIDKGTPSALVPDDFCGRPRTGSRPDWGALEHSLGDCQPAQPRNTQSKGR